MSNKAIEQAQRALDIACLQVLATAPREVKVALYMDGTTVEVVFTKEQVEASCERQLAELKGRNP